MCSPAWCSGQYSPFWLRRCQSRCLAVSLSHTSIAPIVAAMTLGGPTAAGWVALIGTSEYRELSGRVPWYGTLANHAGLVVPAIVGGLARQIALTEMVRVGASTPVLDFVSTLLGAFLFFALNVA